MEQIKIIVGRFDNNKVIQTTDCKTIFEVFNEAGYTKASNEEIKDLQGNAYDGQETVIKGKSYFYVEKVKSMKKN